MDTGPPCIVDVVPWRPPPRDRVGVDLRGIADAVRAAARARQVTLATFARDAIVEALRSPAPPAEPSIGTDSGEQQTMKVTLRLKLSDAEVLVLKSSALGLSYGAFVARLVRGTPLPALAADRVADRAALLKSTDRLALLALDLHGLTRLLRVVNPAGAEDCCASAMAVAADVRLRLDLASEVLAHIGDDP